MPGPDFEKLIKGYVNKIPVLPKDAATGKGAADYFQAKHRYSDVSLFNNKVFENKIVELARNEAQTNHLWYLANQFNLKVQNSFAFKKI